MASEGTNDTADEALQVELSLVDLTLDERDDVSGTNIPVLVADVVDSVSSTTAEAFLSPLQPPKRTLLWGSGVSDHHKAKKQRQEVAQRIQQQVVRFLRVPDKYISFTSILLKSQAFHMTHPSPNDDEQQEQSTASLPVIEIPRTQYKKPYIPSPSKHDSFPEVNLYPLSISHQFPFVGMARLVIHDAAGDPRCRPLVGLDIVTFDDYNHGLYGSLAEFVDVFQSNFTPWEWNCIHAANDDGVMLQEFYLRWAIKEAYTKALGVGMGLSFDSFETRLEHNMGEDEYGIFSWLCQQPLPENSITHSGDRCTNNQPLLLPGSVVINPGTPEAKSEACSFFFLPLWEQEIYGSGRSFENVRGCACICLLQSPDHENGGNISLTTKWQSLEDLISWHRK